MMRPDEPGSVAACAAGPAERARGAARAGDAAHPSYLGLARSRSGTPAREHALPQVRQGLPAPLPRPTARMSRSRRPPTTRVPRGSAGSFDAARPASRAPTTCSGRCASTCPGRHGSSCRSSAVRCGSRAGPNRLASRCARRGAGTSGRVACASDRGSAFGSRRASPQRPCRGGTGRGTRGGVRDPGRRLDRGVPGASLSERSSPTGRESAGCPVLSLGRGRGSACSDQSRAPVRWPVPPACCSSSSGPA